MAPKRKRASETLELPIRVQRPRTTQPETPLSTSYPETFKSIVTVAVPSPNNRPPLPVRNDLEKELDVTADSFGKDEDLNVALEDPATAKELEEKSLLSPHPPDEPQRVLNDEAYAQARVNYLETTDAVRRDLSFVVQEVARNSSLTIDGFLIARRRFSLYRAARNVVLRLQVKAFIRSGHISIQALRETRNRTLMWVVTNNLTRGGNRHLRQLDDGAAACFKDMMDLLEKNRGWLCEKWLDRNFQPSI